MGAQIYTSDQRKPKQIIKIHGETENQIFEQIEELKKTGYEIIEFPPIEQFRRMYIVNILAYNHLLASE